MSAALADAPLDAHHRGPRCSYCAIIELVEWNGRQHRDPLRRLLLGVNRSLSFSASHVDSCTSRLLHLRTWPVINGHVALLAAALTATERTFFSISFFSWHLPGRMSFALFAEISRWLYANFFLFGFAGKTLWFRRSGRHEFCFNLRLLYETLWPSTTRLSHRSAVCVTASHSRTAPQPDTGTLRPQNNRSLCIVILPSWCCVFFYCTADAENVPKQ